MPRGRLIISSEHPYHVRARSNNREWFGKDSNFIFPIFVDVLRQTIEKYNFKIHSFVLMSNHFHLMVTTPNLNLSEGMRFLMTESSRKMRYGTGRINHVYGGRFKPTLITSEVYYLRCFKYIYRNPVRAGLCDGVLDYRFSSLVNADLRKIMAPAENGHAALIPVEEQQLIDWLNVPTPKELEERIKKGLRRTSFQLGKCRKTREEPNPNLDLPT